MLKNKIYKYFSKEILKTFFTVLFAFTAIAWTVRAVNFLDLIVENGFSVKTYLFYSFLNISNIMTKFIPLTFLLALTLSIVKFEKQNEFLILWTSGLKKIKLINLFFLISIFILILQIFFAVVVTPFFLEKSRQLIKTSTVNTISTIIKTNDFSDSFRSTTFFIEKKNSKNEMQNVFIRDESNVFKNLSSSPDNSSDITLTAKKGKFEGSKLILYNGIIQSKKKDNKIENINFSKLDLVLNNLSTRTIKQAKIQETSTFVLIRCLREVDEKLLNCPKGNVKKNVMESISRRIGMPLYIPIVSLIISFLIISNNRKNNNSLKKYIYFLISFIVLILAEVLVRYSGFSQLNAILYFSLPILLCPIIYIILIRKISIEKIKYE